MHINTLIQSAEALGMEVPQNRNVLALSLKFPFRLEISTANLQRSEPEFVRTKAEGKARRKQLQTAGYRVRVMEITEGGGLR